jgi:hypothetical protein
MYPAMLLSGFGSHASVTVALSTNPAEKQTSKIDKPRQRPYRHVVVAGAKRVFAILVSRALAFDKTHH